MLASLGVPRLSYSQLFSFQVGYSNNADSRGYANSGAFGFLARKKGEWKKAILEVDFTMGTFFIQDKDRIILSNTFSAFRRHVTQDDYSDDLLLSIRFETEQWEIMVQNTIEKKTLNHLLQCILDDLSPEDTSKIAKDKGIIGLEKTIMKYGLVYRRAKTAYKKDERFLIVVPGKLLLFKGMDIMGKHARTVTSLAGATVRMIYGQLEFEVAVPNAKSLSFLPTTAEDLTGWIGVIEKSIQIANSDREIGQNQSPRSLTDTSPSRRRADISERSRRRGDELPDEERGPNQQKDKYQVEDGTEKGKYHTDCNYKENPLQGKTKGRQRGEERSGHWDKNESSSKQRGNTPAYTKQGDVRDRYDRERRNNNQEDRHHREDGINSYQRYQGKSAGRGEDGYKGKREQEWSEEEDDDDRNKGKGYREKRKEGDNGHKGKHRQQGQREDSNVEYRRNDYQGTNPDADFGHKGKGSQVRREEEGDNSNSDGYSGKGRWERREEDADDGYRGKSYQGRIVEQKGKGLERGSREDQEREEREKKEQERWNRERQGLERGSREDQEREEREKKEQERWNRERQEKERQRISGGREERRYSGSYQERSGKEQGSRKKNDKDLNNDEERRHSGSYQERSDKEHDSRKKSNKELSSNEEGNHWAGKRRGSSRSRGSSNGLPKESRGGSMTWPHEESDSDDEEPLLQVKQNSPLPLKNPPQNTSQLKKQLPTTGAIQPIRGSNAGLGITSTKNMLEEQEEHYESDDDEEE